MILENFKIKNIFTKKLILVVFLVVFYGFFYVINYGFLSDKEIGFSFDDGFYKVIYVIDGDTIKVEKEDKEYVVRLIGIDTPEIVNKEKPVECFGIESSMETKKLLSNKNIRLEIDNSQDLYDKYGRLLAYVFVENEINFNEYLIKHGFAREYTFIFPYKYQEEFKSAENFAKKEGLGLWSKCY